MTLAQSAETAASAVRARRRIRDHIRKTPLLPSRQAGAAPLFKAEHLQVTGSFKARGAASRMTALSGKARLITASSGNHGIGASHAARATGRDLTVVLPETVPMAKLERIRAYGVEVILHGAESGAAETHARALADRQGMIYVSPYNDPEIIAGQGTIALELLEQADRIDRVFVAMGGGGLIGGIGAVLKAFSPETRLIGVAAENSAALAASMAAGHVVETAHHPTLAEAVAGGVDADTITLPLCRAAVDEVVTLDETAIRNAMRHLLLDEHMLVEGAAALAYAGYRARPATDHEQVDIVVLCGGNLDAAEVLPTLIS